MSIENRHLLASHAPGEFAQTPFLERMDLEERETIEKESEKRDEIFRHQCTPKKVAACAWLSGCFMLHSIFAVKILSLWEIPAWSACAAALCFGRYCPNKIRSDLPKLYGTICCGPCCEVLEGKDIDPDTFPSAYRPYESDSDPTWDGDRISRLESKTSEIREKLNADGRDDAEEDALDYFVATLERLKKERGLLLLAHKKA